MGINIRFIGLETGYHGEKKRMGGIQMIIDFLRELIGRQPAHAADWVLDAEYEPYREELKIAGIDLTKPDTVANAMKLFDSYIDELASIIDEL